MLAEIRVKTLWIDLAKMFHAELLGLLQVPRFAQLYVCNAIVVAERDIDIPKGIEGTTV